MQSDDAIVLTLPAPRSRNGRAGSIAPDARDPVPDMNGSGPARRVRARILRAFDATVRLDHLEERACLLTPQRVNRR